MMIFKKIHDPENQFDVTDVEVKLISDETLDSVLEAFTSFLKASGFYPQGTLEFYDYEQENSDVSDSE